MRTRAATAVALAAALLLPVSAASAAPAVQPPAVQPAPDLVPGELLVTTTSGAVTTVSVPAGQETAAAVALQTRPDVVAVERPRYRRLLTTPNDQLFPRQWAHRLTEAEAAWDITTGSPDVLVAVIDNGVDARHPDLLDNVREQAVVADGKVTGVRPGTDNRTCDGHDHGTAVAGIIGASGDDGFGVAGVAWRVGLLDYAVFRSYDDGGCGASDTDVLAAMRAATAAGADVINLSLGGFSPETACSTAYQTVIDEARAAGAVVVAAAGNAEEDPEWAGQANVPASCNGVISVGAVTADGAHASYSTTNRYVDLAAPGGDSRTGFADGILTTAGDGRHDWLEGTSMAAPYVSGIAALLRAAVPELSADEVEGLLETTARDSGPVGRDPAYGWGLVDASSAVARAVAGYRPVPAADPAFPVSDGSGGPLQSPPSGAPQVFRVSAGAGRTEAVPQAVAMSRSTFAADAAAHAVLARADRFADALAGSALTLGAGPLLFAADGLPEQTREELLRVLPAGSTVYLLGGPAALPATLESELRALGYDPVRLAGRTREETAVAVAREVAVRRAVLGLPDPRTALLATGESWADAVTAGSLGAFYGIPVLLTPTASLHPATAEHLRRLRPDRLLVLGGPAAVSDATFAAAASAAGTRDGRTSRLAGADRYGTAVAVAELFQQLLAEQGQTPRCVLAANVVRPDGFAHALSAATLGGAYGCVMVAVHGADGDRLPVVTRGYVHRFGVDGVLAGSVDVVSEAAAQDLHQLLQR